MSDRTELVQVKLTPQMTADVFIGELHIKTFGGPVAHQAASDFAQQIRNQLEAFRAENWAAQKSVLDTPKEDKADAYKTRDLKSINWNY